MRQLVFGLALCALLAWGVLRDRAQDAGELQQAEFFAMGTLLQIKSLKPLDSTLLAQLQQQLSSFEQRWSVLGNGALAQLNRQLQESREAPLPESLREGFEQARKACQSSQGLFDPATGGLVKLWGFEDENSYREQPPEATQITAAKAQAGSLCSATLGAQIRLDQAGSTLNFGASAKGRAVDLLLATLQAAGHEQVMVNAGGDLKALGPGPDRPWRIGIRHPRPDDNQPLLATLELAPGEAVFSSGDYERYFLHEGQRYHHIIDPRSGYPAGLSQSATVVHHDAQWADAASTALFVAGADAAPALMQAMQIRDWLLVDGEGQIHASDAMRERLADLNP